MRRHNEDRWKRVSRTLGGCGTVRTFGSHAAGRYTNRLCSLGHACHPLPVYFRLSVAVDRQKGGFLGQLFAGGKRR